jgi:hypothetical protein
MLIIKCYSGLGGREGANGTPGADFFVHFFEGKFRGKFSPKKFWEKLQFSAEKASKNRFSEKFRGKFRDFPWKKMYEKSAPALLIMNSLCIYF